MTREQILEATLKTLYSELCSAYLTHPELEGLLSRTDKKCRELGVLPQPYTPK